MTVLQGDADGEGALLEALRQQRYEPVRYRGRPVAVSVYRLISRMEVRSETVAPNSVLPRAADPLEGHSG